MFGGERVRTRGGLFKLIERKVFTCFSVRLIRMKGNLVGGPAAAASFGEDGNRLESNFYQRIAYGPMRKPLVDIVLFCIK